MTTFFARSIEGTSSFAQSGLIAFFYSHIYLSPATEELAATSVIAGKYQANFFNTKDRA